MFINGRKVRLIVKSACFNGFFKSFLRGGLIQRLLLQAVDMNNPGTGKTGTVPQQVYFSKWEVLDG